MSRHKYLMLIALLCGGTAANTYASTVALPTHEWVEFNVDDASADSQGAEWIDLTDSNTEAFGTPSIYQFTISEGYKGVLQVIDGGLSGDRFEIFNNGQSLGFTSETVNADDYSNDFDSNLTNNHFSRGLFDLSAGTYNISGNLFSTLQPFNATNGAIKLEVSTVPLPNSIGLLFCGLSLFAVLRRRRF
ncbi:MAG: hypothetical protein EOO68_01095 [Moraxellaceae bacterium]|nr:MAG: hypothetical protein EOO68_01095 [Moraxellaceae bacterium]